MSEKDHLQTRPDANREALRPVSKDAPDPRQSALALGLEFAKRAAEAESLDDLFFMLTNDFRTLANFDRAFLVSHMGEDSRLVAASNQPTLEKKSRIFMEIDLLSKELRDLQRGVLLSAAASVDALSDEELSPDVRERLLSFMELSGCKFLLCVPLKHNKATLAHLLLEFHDDSVPDRVEMLTLLGIAPLLASALSEKWLLKAKPSVWEIVSPSDPTKRKRGRSLKWGLILGLVGIGLAVLFFLAPVTYTVGGECEVSPRDRHLAFVKIDGIVESIAVKEGDRVKKGQALAKVDERPLIHEIRKTKRRLRILNRETQLLKREGAADPSKLAESELVQLKRDNAAEELAYLEWTRQFLQIRSPVAGIVVTEDVDSLVGKKFKAGEPLCEIAAPGELVVDTFVPENRIGLVKKGQPVIVYLNTEPTTPYSLEVSEIAPLAEALPRLGNVYRVSARFTNAPPKIKIGMKGIGKVQTGRLTLADIVRRRLSERWNQYSIYF